MSNIPETQRLHPTAVRQLASGALNAAKRDPGLAWDLLLAAAWELEALMTPEGEPLADKFSRSRL